MTKGLATVAQHAEFDEVIDVRSPAEFEEDHLPGAINCPVLDNEQRARIGTLYVQVSPFEARKLGAAMVAENIARHLYTRFLDRPKSWRPLIYCWRGGQRSGAFTTWMRMIGWDACQLAGGYKAWRHHVIERLAQLCGQVRFRVVCGATGCGKTRLLHALAAEGAQILDLEALAAHKGSVLGGLPGRAQPSQKGFESALQQAMEAMDLAQPVFVEAESRRIGRIHLPNVLLDVMRSSDCLAVEATREARLAFLLEDYAYLGDDTAALRAMLERLRGLQSNETLDRWMELGEARALPALFAELIDLHYDPLYRRSQNGHYSRLAQAPQHVIDDLSPDRLRLLARRILGLSG
ncbi:MAG: tRNA 2-selenouridine(34) synthase MnmH [Zoogloea sp.]|nr:tRNA 2-selenouridine(34) synthase MnmH [Zoogloea sp.]